MDPDQHSCCRYESNLDPDHDQRFRFRHFGSAPGHDVFPPPLSLCSAILLYAILTICFKVDHSGDGGGGGEVHGITGRRQSGDTVTFIPAGYYYSQLQFLYPLVPDIDPHNQCCESGSS